MLSVCGTCTLPYISRRCLIQPNRRVDLPDGLEDARHALGIELASQHRLVPRRRHERHCGQVVELHRSDVLNDANERELIEQVGRAERDAVEKMIDPPHVRRTQPPHDSRDRARTEEELGEIRPVLSSDPRDDCAFTHEPCQLCLAVCSSRVTRANGRARPSMRHYEPCSRKLAIGQRAARPCCFIAWASSVIGSGRVRCPKAVPPLQPLRTTSRDPNSHSDTALAVRAPRSNTSSRERRHRRTTAIRRDR